MRSHLVSVEMLSLRPQGAMLSRLSSVSVFARVKFMGPFTDSVWQTESSAGALFTSFKGLLKCFGQSS